MQTKTFILILSFQFMAFQNLFSTDKITLLHYNDFHAHLVEHNVLTRHGDACSIDPSGKAVIETRGGIARLKTLVQKIRKENPNNILMNIGDTFHGGAEALFTDGNAIVDPINSLGIDIGVPGNWDFAYGPAVFRKRYNPDGPMPLLFRIMLPNFKVKAVNFQNLAANLTYNSLNFIDPSPDKKEVIPGSIILTRAGHKIGFIGLTSDIVPFMHHVLAKGFNFLQGEDNYRDLMITHANKLKKEGAELIVVMSELGIHKDYRLADVLPKGTIDIIFSAHTHEITKKPLLGKSGTWVVESGDDTYLGKMDIEFKDNRIIGKNWELLSITPAIPEDPEMAELVKKAREPFLKDNPGIKDPTGSTNLVLNRPLTDIAGKTNGLITRIDALDNSFNRAFTEILRKKAETDTAITPGFRYDSSVQATNDSEGRIDLNGNITIEDIYRFFPVSYYLAKGNTTGENFQSALEGILTRVFSKDMFSQRGGWMDGVAGYTVYLDTNNKDNHRILKIVSKQNDKELLPNTQISVAGCIRRFEDTDVLCSHHGFKNIKKIINQETGKPWTPQELLIDYLKDNKLDGNGKIFIDRDNAMAWPKSPFVQPLPEANCIHQ